MGGEGQEQAGASGAPDRRQGQSLCQGPMREADTQQAPSFRLPLPSAAQTDLKAALQHLLRFPGADP